MAKKKAAKKDSKKRPKPSSPSKGLDYKALKGLFPTVEQAKTDRENFSNLFNNAPEGLEAYLNEYASATNVSLDPFANQIADAVEDKDYRALATIGDQVVAGRYGDSLAPYNDSLTNHPESAFRGAPNELTRMVVQRANKKTIEGLEGEYAELAKKHLEVKGMIDNLKDSQSQDREKRRAAKKKIRERFEKEHAGKYTDEKTLNIFRNLTATLHTDFEYHNELVRKGVDELVESTKESDQGRSYLVKAAGGSGMVRRYLETDLSEGLPEQ